MFLLASSSLEKCTLPSCSRSLLSVYYFQIHVLLFEYLKNSAVPIFVWESRGALLVAALASNSGAVFSPFCPKHVSFPSYPIGVTTELPALVTFTTKTTPTCQEASPSPWRGMPLLCDLGHFSPTSFSVHLETSALKLLLPRHVPHSASSQLPFSLSWNFLRAAYTLQFSGDSLDSLT